MNISYDKICIGTANFNNRYGFKKNKTTIKNIKKILEYSKKKKINFLDTAINYSNSKKILSKMNIKKFNLISKISLPKRNIKKLKNWIIKSVIKEKNNLRIKSLYALLLHDTKIFENKKNIFEICEAIDYLKEKKIIKKIGLSIYDPIELDKYFDYYNFEIVQFPLNVFDRRIIDSGWLKKLKKKKVELHARSVFLQGLLLLNKKNLPKKYLKWEKYFKNFDEFVEAKKISKKHACLSLIKNYIKIDKLIIGVNNYRQIKENLELLNLKSIKIPKNLQVNSKRLINPKLW